jgi:hypothetical protein
MLRPAGLLREDLLVAVVFARRSCQQIPDTVFPSFPDIHAPPFA